MNISGHPYENILAPPLLTDTERTINNPFIILFEKTSQIHWHSKLFTTTRQNKSPLFNSKKLTNYDGSYYNVAYF